MVGTAALESRPAPIALGVETGPNATFVLIHLLVHCYNVYDQYKLLQHKSYIISIFLDTKLAMLNGHSVQSKLFSPDL